MSDRHARKLRSQTWFGKKAGQGAGARGWMKNQGYPHDLFDGRPVIGICNTWSELTPCNGHLRALARHVHDGILEAGGFPLEFPVTSLGETLMRPTTMLYRNLASMDVEETIRANPLDAVVLMAGCDKTTPALVMGAASCDIPSIVVSGGPMLNGWYRGERLGNGTSNWRQNAMLKTGELTVEQALELEEAAARSIGHCNTMGTASSMATVMEALGLALPYNASIPAADARRNRLARMSGRRAVDLALEDVKISQILTKQAFENAITAIAAVGGSTNAVVHTLAIANRLELDFTLSDWDRVGRDVPCLVDIMPSGMNLMEDFHYAGGLPAVFKQIETSVHRDAMTVSGEPIGASIDTVSYINENVIHRRSSPVRPNGGIAVLHGNLAPGGAVIKPSAASDKLMKHKGRAVVFDGVEDLRARIDSDDLDVDENSVLVLRGCGPAGFPGMPEVGNMTLPRNLLAKGVTDMVRITDGRMSGTAFGTVVLHVTPESARGGPLAAVRDGDVIELDVAKRRIVLEVSDAELDRRLSEIKNWDGAMEGGWQRIYARDVLQADRGADLEVLTGTRGSEPPLK